MNEPVWVREEVVLFVHARQIAEHGGPVGLRDAGLLASALNRPKNLLAYTPENTDLAALAAAYAYGIIQNHPFLDGNKRTAYVVCRTFLLLNGFDLVASEQEKFETFLSLANSSMTEAALAAWIREHLRPR